MNTDDEMDAFMEGVDECVRQMKLAREKEKAQREQVEEVKYREAP